MFYRKLLNKIIKKNIKKYYIQLLNKTIKKNIIYN